MTREPYPKGVTDVSKTATDLIFDLANAADCHAIAVKAVDRARADEARHAEQFDDLIERLRPALRNVPEMTVFNVGGVVLVWDGDTLNHGRLGHSHELTLPADDARPAVADCVTDLDDAA